ncbi:Target of rapamycin complex 2 subunit [Dirofilaria immitis]
MCWTLCNRCCISQILLIKKKKRLANEFNKYIRYSDSSDEFTSEINSIFRQILGSWVTVKKNLLEKPGRF